MILNIFLIMLIIGIILLIFLNQKSPNIASRKDDAENFRGYNKRSDKKVRFNDKLDFAFDRDDRIIDVTSSCKKTIDGKLMCKINKKSKANYSCSEDLDGSLICDIDDDSDVESSEFMNYSDVKPINLENDDPDSAWYDSFSQPLISKDASKKFTDKLKKSYAKYNESFNDMAKYRMDQESLIQTDIKIDPFTSDPGTKKMLRGETIKSIYDKQVAPPKAVPKKIKSLKNDQTIYENETEMNSGFIQGTKLHAYGTLGSYQSAAFGDEF